VLQKHINSYNSYIISVRDVNGQDEGGEYSLHPVTPSPSSIPIVGDLFSLSLYPQVPAGP